MFKKNASRINTPKDFLRVATRDSHRQRRRDIIKSYPELRSLTGCNPYSMLLILSLVMTQLTLAYLLRTSSLWLIVLGAYCGGAFLAASLTAMIHEASHTLIFRHRTANHVAGAISNLPLVLLSAEPFFHYHLWHHRALGDYKLDVGIPTEWEARWVGNSRIRKTIWLACFPAFQFLRTLKFTRGGAYWHRWMLVNLFAQLCIDALLLWAWGPKALVYLLLSYSFSFGLHPLGTRVIQEHFNVLPDEETNNYGGVNIIECNFGFHVEHHDFPNIPWNRLPKVRKIASEYYKSLHSFPSRWRLMFDFILNPEWNLYRHTVREWSVTPYRKTQDTALGKAAT